MLIGVGVVMWFADVGKCAREHRPALHAVDAVIIGVAQALAIVPGTSRSGITITAGTVPRLDARQRLDSRSCSPHRRLPRPPRRRFYDMQKQGGIPPTCGCRSWSA